MRRAFLGVAVMALAAAAGASVFERFLSPDRPADRAIMKYLELARSGKATSMELADLGVLIFEKGFPGDAIDYLQAALKLDGRNYEAAYRLGLVLQREGSDREAAKYYKKVLKLRPGYAQARFMLALAEERCGERRAAIHDYAKAYRYAPELADAHRNPLVLDSELQTEAMLRHYAETMRTSTLRVTEIDPAAIQRMVEAVPAPAAQPGEARPPSGPPAAQPGEPPAAAGSSAQRGRGAPPATAGEAPAIKLDVRTGAPRVPRQEGGRRTQLPPATPPPPPAEPTPAPDDESAAPAPSPEEGQEAPAPPPEQPPGDEPKPTPPPTR